MELKEGKEGTATCKDGNLSITFQLQNTELIVDAVDEKNKKKWKTTISDSVPVATGNKQS
jgi:hypothetical protein